MRAYQLCHAELWVRCSELIYLFRWVDGAGMLVGMKVGTFARKTWGRVTKVRASL
jgi:hypothetical protein